MDYKSLLPHASDFGRDHNQPDTSQQSGVINNLLLFLVCRGLPSFYNAGFHRIALSNYAGMALPHTLHM